MSGSVSDDDLAAMAAQAHAEAATRIQSAVRGKRSRSSSPLGSGSSLFGSSRNVVRVGSGGTNTGILYLTLSWHPVDAPLPEPSGLPPPSVLAVPPPTRKKKSTAGVIRVHLKSAERLRAADKNGLSDPYVKLHLGGMSERSAVVKKTLNPKFDWDFAFRFSHLDTVAAQKLSVEVGKSTRIITHEVHAHTIHRHKAGPPTPLPVCVLRRSDSAHPSSPPS